MTCLLCILGTVVALYLALIVYGWYLLARQARVDKRAEKE